MAKRARVVLRVGDREIELLRVPAGRVVLALAVTRGGGGAVERWIRSNWGGPLVLTFIILLTCTAVLLAVGDMVNAEVVAEYAYIYLVVGVALMVVQYLREGRSFDDQPDSDPVSLKEKP